MNGSLRPRVFAAATLPVSLLALIAAGCATREQPVSPTAAEIARMHDELHFIERACESGTTSSQRARIREGVSYFLDLSGRYPEARFFLEPEGGEEARMLSVLLVVREALSGCVPQEAGRVDGALPEELRKGSGS